MDQGWELNAEQWSAIDRSLLNCCQLLAYRSIQEMIETGPEEAKHIALQRFHFLRAKRSHEFAWRDFPCEDYLASEWADHGCWDTPFTMILRPATEVELRPELGFLLVGGPGCDGIMWGYRIGHPGVWEYDPMSGEFTHRAESVEELVQEIFLRQPES
jgi:hypothetical protein